MPTGPIRPRGSRAGRLPACSPRAGEERCGAVPVGGDPVGILSFDSFWAGEATGKCLPVALANVKTTGEALPRPLALPRTPAERLRRSRRPPSACLRPSRRSFAQPVTPPECFRGPLALPSAPRRPPLPAVPHARANGRAFLLTLPNVSGGPAAFWKPLRPAGDQRAPSTPRLQPPAGPPAAGSSGASFFEPARSRFGKNDSREWRILGREPSVGDICWFNNTPAGNERAHRSGLISQQPNNTRNNS